MILKQCNEDITYSDVSGSFLIHESKVQPEIFTFKLFISHLLLFFSTSLNEMAIGGHGLIILNSMSCGISMTRVKGKKLSLLLITWLQLHTGLYLVLQSKALILQRQDSTETRNHRASQLAG